MKKLLECIQVLCVWALSFLILIGLLVLVDWVDPWWNTGFTKSPPLEQGKAMLFWCLVTIGPLVGLLMAREGYFDRDPDSLSFEIKRWIPDNNFLKVILFSFLLGALAFVLFGLDSNSATALFMSTVVTTLALLFLGYMQWRDSRTATLRKGTA
ncbi:MAG: hypothetical protein Q7R88_00730 [bacterium]|nr:hypothetical protein [bacterium]